MELRYTIPLAPVTKKNHQQIMYNARTGRRFVKPSPQYEQYAEAARWFLQSQSARRSMSGACSICQPGAGQIW